MADRRNPLQEPEDPGGHFTLPLTGRRCSIINIDVLCKLWYVPYLFINNDNLIILKRGMTLKRKKVLGTRGTGHLKSTTIWLRIECHISSVNYL